MQDQNTNNSQDKPNCNLHHRSSRSLREINVILGCHVGKQNSPILFPCFVPLFFIPIKQLIYVSLSHPFLPQRRTQSRFQMINQTLDVNLSIPFSSIRISSAIAGARPPSLRHNHGNIFVTGDGHSTDHSINHDIEQVPVLDSGDRIFPEIEGFLFLKQSKANGDIVVEIVDRVRVKIDEEGGIGFVQEIEEGFDDELGDGLVELGRGGRESGGHDVDERESGGKGNGVDAEGDKGGVEVAEGGEEEGREVGGGGKDVGAEGDGGDVGAGVEGDDVGVEEEIGGGAIGGEGGEEGVGEGEEEGDVGVGEGPDHGGGGVGEADGRDFEGLEGGGHVVRRRTAAAAGVGHADAARKRGGSAEEEEREEKDEEEGGVERERHFGFGFGFGFGFLLCFLGK
ncbi:unnamed protein product [Camellia sinensis]